MSPGSCIFPYIESAKFTEQRHQIFFINSNLLMFWLPGFVAKIAIYPGSSLNLSRGSHSRLTERLPHGLESAESFSNKS